MKVLQLPTPELAWLNVSNELAQTMNRAGSDDESSWLMRPIELARMTG